MISSVTLIGDVKSEFEGGSSLSIEWDSFIVRAVNKVLDKIRPTTLKRRQPIYGGVAQDLYTYYAPSDVLAPAALYPNEGHAVLGIEKRKYGYIPPPIFYKNLPDDKFTLEYINGVRFVILNHNRAKSSTTIDAMNSLGTKSGGSASLNEHNYIQGGGAIQFSITDAGVTLSDTITAKDISDYLKGIASLPTYIDDKTKLFSIEVRLLSSTGNYYSVITTADDIEDYFINGWNLIRFNIDNASETGSPDSEAIVEWQVIGTAVSGQTLNLIIDNFTIQKTDPFYFDYYSNYPYATSAGVLWQSTMDNSAGDQINFDRDAGRILHYELCLLVERASSFKHDIDFKAELLDAYNDYNEKHPSDEEPLSYSKSPEIDISSDYEQFSLQNDDVAVD